MDEHSRVAADRDARPPLEAVLLDAGGVLVRLDFEWMSQTLAAMDLPVSAAELRRAEVQGRRRYDASLGTPPAPGELPTALGSTGDTDAYFVGTLEAAGVPPAVIPAVIERFMVRQKASGLWGRPNEGARKTLDALVRLGLRRAVVSNSDGRAERHLIDSGVRDGIELVVDSHVVGVEKPDPRIFRIALEALGVAADRALFVGDIRSVDEAGARAAGVHFVLIDPFGDYAAPGTPAIADIGALPDHLAAHFHIVPSAPGGAARSAETAGGRAGGDS